MFGFLWVLAHKECLKKTHLCIYFPFIYFVCGCFQTEAAAAKNSVAKKEESREKREKKESFSIFSFQNPPAENFRFLEIERSDHRDFWSAALQQLGQRFGPWDRGFEVCRSGFCGVLHSSNYWVIFPHLCYIFLPYILMYLFPSV